MDTTVQNKWPPDWEKLKEFPKERLKQVYDTDDNVLFGSRYVKGKVAYNYAPAVFMETGRDFIVNTSIAYDGKGNVDLPKDAELLPWDQLKTRFPDNKFS